MSCSAKFLKQPKFQMFDMEDQAFAVVLHDVTNRLRVMIERKAQPYRLTRLEWLVLSILQKRSALTQSELALELGVDRSAIASLVRRMEDRKLIYRKGDKNDRRIVRVYINEGAMPVLKDLEIVSDDVSNTALKGLTSKEQEEFLNCLFLIRNNLV